MNKTVTANISGVVFHIETEAYEKLHQYLATIKRYFKDSDGTEEIMADIEARIAELFKEILDSGKDVITNANVQKVVEIMGEPEQYMDEDASEEYSGGSYRSESRFKEFKTRKLFRDPDDNVLGGVCSGLGYYFGIDKIWLRAAFLIAVFGFGTGFLVYLLLWIIIPASKNTAEKLEMKGEPINVQNIGNSIKDEFNDFKKKVNTGNSSQFGRKAESAAYQFFHFLSRILLFFLKFIAKVVGAVLILAAIVGLIVLVTFTVGAPLDYIDFGDDFINILLHDSGELFFSTIKMYYFTIVAIIIVVLLPLFGLFYGGLKILFDIPSSNRAVNVSAISLFIVGVIMIFISLTTTLAEYSNEQKKIDNIVLNEIPSDTLSLYSLENTISSYDYGHHDEFFMEQGRLYLNDFSVDVIKSRTDDVVLKMRKWSNGRNRKDAGNRAENVNVEYELNGSELKVSPLISVPYEDRFRKQQARLSIALPVGKTIYLGSSSQEVIYDIKNITDTYDRDMLDHHWLMTERGLKCTDCEEEEEETELEDLETIAKDIAIINEEAENEE